MFVSGSQDVEIFILPAVPTEYLDGVWQPHFLMSLHSVFMFRFHFFHSLKTPQNNFSRVENNNYW